MSKFVFRYFADCEDGQMAQAGPHNGSTAQTRVFAEVLLAGLEI